MRSTAIAAMLCVTLAGCDTGGTTRIDNKGDQPITLVYAARGEANAVRVSVAPGEARQLPGDRSLSRLDRLRITQAGRDYVFGNWKAARSRTSCGRSCTIRWFGEGRLSIGP
jgi:hypothetical protein